MSDPPHNEPRLLLFRAEIRYAWYGISPGSAGSPRMMKGSETLKEAWGSFSKNVTLLIGFNKSVNFDDCRDDWACNLIDN